MTLSLTPPRITVMRKMLQGETVLFRRMSSNDDKLVKTHQSRCGGKFTTKKLIMVDPRTSSSCSVLLVTCIIQPTVDIQELVKKFEEKE